MGRHYAILLITATITTSSLIAAVSLPTEDGVTTLPTEVQGPAKQAMDAFREGRHSQAVELATPLADAGNAEAQYLLGYAHETGQGLEASREKALEYYRKAADGKHKDAVYRMSFLLLASDKEEERKKAGSALEAAAKEDPAVAGRILGEAYLRGLLSAKPDSDKALEWWKQSAEIGDVTSRLLIARFYEGEFGFPEKKDPKLAVENYRKAAELGNADAMVTLGSRYLQGDEKVRDEAKGREWLNKAMGLKVLAAYLVLGDYEENVKKDLKAALALYERGRDAGQADCILRTADFYLEGKGVGKDEDRGVSLLKAAAQAGHPVANLRLAAAYLSPEKITSDGAIVGYQHLLVAANANLPQAQHELGLLYLSGKLGSADGPAGVAWLTRAAQGGHTLAQFHLASLYLRGVGSVPQNLQNAGELFALAANGGHAGAMLALAEMNYSGIGTKSDLVRAWVLGSLAAEAKQEGADALVKQMEPKMTAEQRNEARKELAKAKAGSDKEE